MPDAEDDASNIGQSAVLPVVRGNGASVGSSHHPYTKSKSTTKLVARMTRVWGIGRLCTEWINKTLITQAPKRKYGMDRMMRAVLALGTALTLVSTVVCTADMPTTRDAREPDYQTLFAQLEKTDVVQEGATEAKSVLYVFFDANCFYCHLTWKAVHPYEAVGLQVRWVPVAYQQPSSVGRAAAIMQAPDRAAALRVNEIGYNAARFDGGIQPMDKVPRTLLAKLQANTQLMRKFGAPATPALAWKDRDGKVRFKIGVPRLSELPTMTGLPAQPIDDPELAKFR